MSLAPGARVGRYEVRSTLGVGGMGEVYLAHDSGLRRNVALKILPDSYAGDPARKERFLREATTASALSHPNVAVVYEAGETDEGRAFLTMEHVSGDTLAHILQSRRLSIDEILEIGIQIADALDEARHLRIVHRDLKPGNIMIDTRDRVKILDFGIAKALQPDVDLMTSAPTAAAATEAGVILGTAAYMSPEQAAGQSVDHRSDLFSLGAVLYEMVSGKRPFPGISFSEIVSRVQQSQPERLTTSRSDCPAELERIIARCLE
ncbi:MAG TPA: serine/threonine-protein kinase, partial [Thermoanaerobaculia bacterium]|nr:serine/threonine-protein kinase [Thermoanaerobaculia bacterium]